MSHPDEGILQELLDGELPPSDAAAVRAHLAGCVPCAVLLRDPALDRAGTLDLPIFRGAGRTPALDLDLGLVMGSSEVCATLSAAPPQPHLGKRRQGKDPNALQPARPPQQRSNQA